MRTVELLQLLAVFPMFLGIALRVGIRRIEAQLRRAGATTPERAIAIASRLPAVRFAHRRLAAAGAIRCLQDGRCYIDQAGWQRWQQSRRKRALTAVACVLLLFALLWAAGVIR